MAFPDVIVECAFDNDINEYLYAQGGYSDITQFVKAISGELRGRRYEMDNVETGSIQITLDNSDGRFTPGSADSPYAPYVKPSRRVRVRGNNLQRVNVASAGSMTHDTTGFNQSTYYPGGGIPVVQEIGSLTGDNVLGEPMVQNLASGRGVNPEGSATITKGVDYGDATYDRVTASAALAGVRLNMALSDLTDGHTYTASVEVANDGDTDTDVELDWCDTGNTTFTIPAGGIETISVTGTLADYTSTYRFIDLAVVNSGANILYRNFMLVEGSSPYPYFDGDTEGHLNSDGTYSQFVWRNSVGASPSVELRNPIGAGTHFVQSTIPAGTAAGSTGFMSFNVPLEIGRRLTHTVYVWLVSGTAPVGNGRFAIKYFDADGNHINTNPYVDFAAPMPNVPQRYTVSHTPPVMAAYATGEIHFVSTAAFTEDLTVAVGAVMTNDAPNLALNPNGDWDADNWYVTGTSGTDVTSGSGQVSVTMASDGSDSEFYTYVGGTVPGEDYTVALSVQQFDGSGAAPTSDLFITADGGQSGATVGGRGVFETAVLTFTATDTSQKVAIQNADGSPFGAGWKINVKGMNAKPGTTDPGLYVAGSADDVMDWELPKPIFEGWIESWPLTVSGPSPEISVVANDRLKRIGGITLESTWREAIFADDMELVIPFDDDPVDAKGQVAQIGTWASTDQIIAVPFSSTRGDLGTSGYTLGVEGPTTETAIDWMGEGLGTAAQGYYLAVPFSKDYVAPPPPPPPPPAAPKPPPPRVTYSTYTYTETYFATWSRSYDGDLSTTWDDSVYCYQGYYDGNRGLTRSLIGFNYKAIMADLSGTTVKSCTFSAMNAHAYSYSGVTGYLGTHSLASKPSTWNTNYVGERRGHAWWDEGDWRTVDMGVTIGNEFKAGYAKGIAFGPPPSTSRSYYGYWYGARTEHPPFLRLTFTKTVAHYS